MTSLRRAARCAWLPAGAGLACLVWLTWLTKQAVVGGGMWLAARVLWPIAHKSVSPLTPPTPSCRSPPPPTHRAVPQHIPSQDVETLPSGMLEPAAAAGEHPRVSAAKQALQQRLKDQAA